MLEDLRRFDEIGLSRLRQHGVDCCRFARAALLSRLDRREVGGVLAGIPAVIAWAPTKWPAYWCQIEEAGEHRGDCGVHAAVAATILERRSVPHSRGRAALRPPPLMLSHWRAAWARNGISDMWIGTSLVHHEVIRIGDRWWDPTEARWFEGPGSSLASGLVVAVRAEFMEWQTVTAQSGPRPAPGKAGS
jgi:hypothetical protein